MTEEVTARKIRFDRVAVIGVGLIGGSFALALKARGACGTVVGVGRHPANTRLAAERGIVDSVETDAAACAQAGCDTTDPSTNPNTSASTAVQRDREPFRLRLPRRQSVRAALPGRATLEATLRGRLLDRAGLCGVVMATWSAQAPKPYARPTSGALPGTPTANQRPGVRQVSV